MSRYNHYNWQGVRYGNRRNAPTADPLTKWILIALLLAIVCHIIVLIAMKKMPIFFQSNAKDELIIQSVVVRNVEDQSYLDTHREQLPEELTPPVETADALIEELEMLEESPEDIEIDFAPSLDPSNITVPMEAPAISGDFDSSALDLTSGLNISEVIEDLGTTSDFLKPAVGQITVDPGKQAADEFDPDLFNIELAKGAEGETRDGVLEGFTPLSEMTRLSQADLSQAKGMIGSDLLFEFNKSTLRESAKNSLLKVVLIIDKNPTMKCWIEGHTDLIGSKESNIELSVARAEAVKFWLVHSMKIPESNLFVIGLGESSPIVLDGDQHAQAINRRVEIKMRNEEPPTLDVEEPAIRKPRIIKPLRNPNLVETHQDILQNETLNLAKDNIKPKLSDDTNRNPALKPLPNPVIEQNSISRAIPVEDTESLPTPPKAVPIEPNTKNNELIPSKAVPVEEVKPSKAIPVDEPNEATNPIKIPPKAVPIE